MGIQPSEFWRMHPAEFYLLYDDAIERQQKADGKMTDRELDEMYRELWE